MPTPRGRSGEGAGGGAAGMWDAEPAPGLEHLDDLGCHLARSAGDVAPAVAKHALAVDGGVVVAA